MLDIDKVHHTQWRVVDSHWRCINVPDLDLVLCEFLNHFGFDVPECITYCLAESFQGYALKYRHFGGTINIYIHKI